LVQLSLQPSVLEQAFLRVSDVKVGEIVKVSPLRTTHAAFSSLSLTTHDTQGTVKRLSDTALFVSISGNVDGVVWPLHYSDIKLKHPEKRFKIGNVVKARVSRAHGSVTSGVISS
jgi:rRNA biogenesis protein RRP5